jgi:hypothetical protein
VEEKIRDNRDVPHCYDVSYSTKFNPNKMFTIDTQLSRNTDTHKIGSLTSRFKDENEQKRTKHDWLKLNKNLPGYMQNQSHRFSCHIANQKTLRETHQTEHDFTSFKSTLNDKKLFRVDPETGKIAGQPIKHKQSKPRNYNETLGPTFVQLLSRNGYVDYNEGQDARKRAWHVPSQKEQMQQLESDSDEDYTL